MNNLSIVITRLFWLPNVVVNEGLLLFKNKITGIPLSKESPPAGK